MVGLIQFLPTPLLIFVAGHAADRYERKRVVQLCQIAEGATRAVLAVGDVCRLAHRGADLIATVVFGITARSRDRPGPRCCR